MSFCKLFNQYILLSILLSLGLSNSAVLANNIPKPTEKPVKLSKIDIHNTKIIQNLIKENKWKQIKKHIYLIENSLLKKTLLWKYYVSQNSGATFHEIDKFLKNETSWPQNQLLRQRAEEAMKPSIGSEYIIKWFEDKMPLTSDGGIRLGEALLKVSQKSEAIQILRKTWVKDNFGATQERIFYRRYRHYLTRQNHLDRLERLLWNGKYYPVRRMLNKVNKNYRALAFARISLRQYRGGVDRAISMVPKHLINHPGLIFERLRWRRRKGRDMDAIKLLQELPENLSRRNYWWKERAILVRRLMHKGHISQAYDIARKHGLDSGKSFVEAEWIAGWIALRFLNEGRKAFKHFEAVYNGSKYPISRARGAYWAGRASETFAKSEQIKIWHKKAAKYSLTYYGQHARTKINEGNIVSALNKKISDNNSNYEFRTNELVRAVNLLGKANLFDLIKPFVIKLNKLYTSTEWQNYVAILARKNGRPDLAVFTAKKAYRSGIALIREGYPVFPVTSNKKLNLPLLFALIRQESAFNNNAVSHAGARGLMQIMPRTARRIAKNNNIPYDRYKLTKDYKYNLKLGKIYLTGLLNQYNGSLILSLAAYNAGPGRINSWIKINGDPRSKNIDKIDWVEMIPYKETRNYVQRVIENYNVYKEILETKEHKFKINDRLSQELNN